MLRDVVCERTRSDFYGRPKEHFFALEVIIPKKSFKAPPKNYWWLELSNRMRKVIKEERLKAR